MANEIRDKLLTEAMGLVWHDFHWHDECWYCSSCKIEGCECDPDSIFHQNYDFSIWFGFGKLWEWATKQEWWSDIYHCYSQMDDVYCFIKPDEFANAIYDYLNPINGIEIPGKS